MTVINIDYKKYADSNYKLGNYDQHFVSPSFYCIPRKVSAYRLGQFYIDGALRLSPYHFEFKYQWDEPKGYWVHFDGVYCCLASNSGRILSIQLHKKSDLDYDFEKNIVKVVNAIKKPWYHFIPWLYKKPAISCGLNYQVIERVLRDNKDQLWE